MSQEWLPSEDVYIFDVFLPKNLAEPGGLFDAIKSFKDEGRRFYIILDFEQVILEPAVDCRTLPDNLPICSFIKNGLNAIFSEGVGKRRNAWNRFLKEEEVLQVLIQNLDLDFSDVAEHDRMVSQAIKAVKNQPISFLEEQ